MKRMLFAALLIIAISSTALARDFVASGKSFTALGDYKIEKADKPFTMNGEELRTYIISKGKNCQNYLVLSDKLSVQYVCNEYYFGVEKLDKSTIKGGYATSDDALNRSEYFRQKLICHGKNGEILNTQLIASYFPVLIKDTEKSGANM